MTALELGADAIAPPRPLPDVHDQCALVVRLFRAPVFKLTQEDVLEEACAGMVDHEGDEAAARREAYEELGVSLHGLERVARIWSGLGWIQLGKHLGIG